LSATARTAGEKAVAVAGRAGPVWRATTQLAVWLVEDVVEDEEVVVML
jgi:hypothetical protein